MKTGYLTPASIPITKRSYVIRVPDVDLFRWNVAGALSFLNDAENWTEYGAVTPDEAAQAAIRMWLEAFEGPTFMLGAIIDYATTEPPPGVLPCDGTTYLRVDYPALYSVLDSVFIVDADSFTVPDLRGRTTVSDGIGPGLSERNIGEFGGEEAHVLTVGELAEHSHLYTPPVLNIDVEGAGVPDVFAAGVGAPTNTDPAGNNDAHNNMQPFFVLRKGIIAL